MIKRNHNQQARSGEHRIALFENLESRRLFSVIGPESLVDGVTVSSSPFVVDSVSSSEPLVVPMGGVGGKGFEGDLGIVGFDYTITQPPPPPPEVPLAGPLSMPTKPVETIPLEEPSGSNWTG